MATKYSYSDKLYAAVVLQDNEAVFLNMMAASMIFISVIVHLIVTSGINIPYGKHTSAKWGFMIPAKIAWALMEIWSLVIPIWIYLSEDQEVPLTNMLLISLFVLHYANRSIMYPIRMNAGNPMPVTIMLMATMFTTYNGYMQGAYLLKHASYPENWLFEPNFIIGIIIFFVGMHINISCDNILKSLRKSGKNFKRTYKIPYGNMFEYVCCGNLFGECVEWFGWALACWSIQAAAFSIFTILVLSAKSYSTYLWYVKKFDNFPKDRKVFIPFIF